MLLVQLDMQRRQTIYGFFRREAEKQMALTCNNSILYRRSGVMVPKLPSS